MKKTNTRKIVGISVFAALAFVAMLYTRIPVPPFLTLDLKDAVLALGGLFYGAAVGPLLALVIAFLEFFLVSGTGIYGFLMNFVGSAAFSLMIPLLYRRRRTTGGLIVGSALSVAAMTVVMIFANLIITPLYTNTPVQAVVAMIPTVFLPFNVAKGLINSFAVMLLYPPIVSAARRARLLDASAGSDEELRLAASTRLSRKEATIYGVSLAAIALIAAGLLVFLFLA